MNDLERTEDGHHIIVGGRRWRATDPSIPEAFRTELVAELMAARRAVGAARRADDGPGEAAARRRVTDSKVALGERGHPWWEPADADALGERAEHAVRALLRHRAPTSSICPSDVARTIGGDRWRTVMEAVRAAAVRLAVESEIEITAGNEVLATDKPFSGPVRLRRGPQFPDSPPVGGSELDPTS